MLSAHATLPVAAEASADKIEESDSDSEVPLAGPGPSTAQQAAQQTAAGLQVPIFGRRAGAGAGPGHGGAAGELTVADLGEGERGGVESDAATASGGHAAAEPPPATAGPKGPAAKKVGELFFCLAKDA